MIRKGKVISTSIESITTAGLQARKVQVQMTEAADTRSYDLMLAAGEDSCPQKGDTVWFDTAGMEMRGTVIATRDPIVPTVNAGEKEFYSYTSAGVKQARLKLKANGKIYAATVTGSTDLGTILLGLIDQIKAITTAGSPGVHQVDPTTQANLETYKAQIRLLLDTGA